MPVNRISRGVYARSGTYRPFDQILLQYILHEIPQSRVKRRFMHVTTHLFQIQTRIARQEQLTEIGPGPIFSRI